ncbi:DUF6216 family protein [Orbaceae bacterium ac157xtp]
MDYNQFFGHVNVIIESPWLKYLGSFIVFILYSFLMIRWNLIPFIKDRLWRIFLGRKYSDFINPEWKKYHNINVDIAHFNTLYRVKANTAEQINKYLCWLHRNGINAIQVSKVRNCFCIESLSFKKITKGEVIFHFSIFLISLFIGLFCLNFSVSSSTLVEIESNEPWFWLADDYAKNSQVTWIPGSNSKWMLRTSDCNSEKFDMEKWAIKANMSVTTGETLCEIFADKGIKGYVANAVKKQRVFFIPMLILFLIYSCFAFKNLKEFSLTQKLENQIKRNEKQKKE